MATIELKGVSKRFGVHNVIHDIDLLIADREFMAFVGPSGSGKSTLLRMIAGLADVSGGEVLIDGLPVQDSPPAKRGLAMVFQSYALYPHMTVAENISFSLRLAGIPKKERDRKIQAVARLLGMESLLDRKPRQLSGGQLQRVAIGRAMVRQPKAFLFDEPLSNLDAALQAQMRLELVRLHRELNTTMVYVTHDQLEAMTMADRIAVLNNGRIEQLGSPLELYHQPATVFVAGFIGAPRMNFLDAKVVTAIERFAELAFINGQLLRIQRPDCFLEVGTPVKLGVRPEDLSIRDDGYLQGEVEVVEHLGARAYVYIRVSGGTTLVAQADGSTRIRSGDQVRLCIDADAAHLFDDRGNAIPRRPTLERRT